MDAADKLIADILAVSEDSLQDVQDALAKIVISVDEETVSQVSCQVGAFTKQLDCLLHTGYVGIA